MAITHLMLFQNQLMKLIIDFSPVFSKTTDLVKIGKEIKNRMRQEIGDWISCNIGIATNRFLAKTAASLHKPDGLDLINYKNLKQVYASIKLTDLHGINTRFEYRLNANGINSPLDFFQAEVNFLKKMFSRVLPDIIGISACMDGK